MMGKFWSIIDSGLSLGHLFGSNYSMNQRWPSDKLIMFKLLHIYCGKLNLLEFYVIDLTMLLANSLDLSLYQISHFLVKCMNKSLLVLPTWPRFFLHLGCFCLAYDFKSKTKSYYNVLASSMKKFRIFLGFI